MQVLRLMLCPFDVGIMQVIVNDWFLPINSSMVHYIHV